jgi:putative tricarboxylic transport membrane protein
MRTNYRPIRSLAIAASMIAASVSAGYAQGWQPTEEVEIITHSGSTSSTWTNADTIARVARELDLFPNGITVTIVDGAQGAKARTYVGKDHAGDPHKLQMMVPTQIQVPILAQSEVNRSLFRGIAMMLITPKAITVNADSPYKTFDDLLKAAREKPGEIIHGGGDLGSTSSMVSKVMEEYFKIDVTYTPFEDQGVVQLLGGHIDYIFAQPEITGKFVKAGRMRYLASSQKLEAFPDVPTLAELGHNFEVFDSWRGVWTSKDVPDEAVAFYVDVLKKVMESDTFKKYMVENSMNPKWVTGDELEKTLDGEIETFTKIATDMDLIK